MFNFCKKSAFSLIYRETRVMYNIVSVIANFHALSWFAFVITPLSDPVSKRLISQFVRAISRILG